MSLRRTLITTIFKCNSSVSYMEYLVRLINNLNTKVGNTVSWLTSILVWVMCLDVTMRYLFNISFAGLFELEWHIFALIFLLGAAFTLKADKHVRVDVFYGQFSEKGKAWVNLTGTIIFLVPFCLVVIASSIPFVINSFSILEGSPDPGGLPFRFIVKSAIPIGFSLLLLQAFGLIMESILIIRGRTQSNV